VKARGVRARVAHFLVVLRRPLLKLSTPDRLAAVFGMGKLSESPSTNALLVNAPRVSVLPKQQQERDHVPQRASTVTDGGAEETWLRNTNPHWYQIDPYLRVWHRANE
jgi:hypothetical protein